MAERSPARLLAPVALVAFAVALVLVIATSDAPRTPPGGTVATTGPQGRPLPRTYRVKRGDTLSRISERTGVSVARLEELNPDLDPIALTPGQRIKLRP